MSSLYFFAGVMILVVAIFATGMVAGVITYSILHLMCKEERHHEEVHKRKP